MTIAAPSQSPSSPLDIPDRAPPIPIHSSRALLAFFAFTFMWTWGLWGLVGLIRPQAPGLSGALYLLGAFGPGIAAFAVVLAFEGAAGLRRWLGQCLRWRVGWRWYALVIVAPTLILWAALEIHAALDGTIPVSPYAGRLPAAIAEFALIAVFGGPLGEEFGWRGYALPALSARFGWRGAGLLIGVAWGLWHLPLLFMANTAQADLPVALFLISTVGLSVVFARLGVQTGFSVVPALLLHTVINWWSMIVPIAADGRAYALVAGIATLVSLIACLAPGPKGRPPQGAKLPADETPRLLR
ncbi:MAG: type II CAAX prenyl endopeptidase Rce1 family protein [Caulobacterales bacterium]